MKPYLNMLDITKVWGENAIRITLSHVQPSKGCPWKTKGRGVSEPNHHHDSLSLGKMERD